MNYLDKINHSLYPYQERDMNNVIHAFETNRRVLFQAIVSYGKTYSFCTVAKYYVETEKTKVLILCHREELVNQAFDACMKMGLIAEKIVSSKKNINFDADVFIAMEKTIYNRLNRNKYFLKDISTVIIDETHILFSIKHMKFFETQRVLGFTATPVLLGNETFYKCPLCNTEYSENTQCHGTETMEWQRPKTMSKYYDDIVIGASPQELIELGQIVPDYTIPIPTDLSGLKTDSTGDYTTKSLNKTFNNAKIVYNVLKQYEDYCIGLKTMIFTASTENNLSILEQFTNAGYNAKLFDSVNDTDLNRKETIEWFESNSDAILINTGIFTVGFSSNEVQAIIVNRATQSLSLWIQICGRGARSSKNIFKDKFILIDLGGNHLKFNSFIDPDRDWRKIFFNGIGKEKAKIEPIEAVRECGNCGALTNRNNTECEVCGHVEVKEVKEKVIIMSDEIAKPIELPPPPNAQKIIEYTKMKGGDLNLAIKIFIEQIIMLFRFHQVSKQVYENTLKNGNFEKKIIKLSRPAYFQFIASDLEQRKNVKLDTFFKKIYNKVAQYYERL